MLCDLFGRLHSNGKPHSLKYTKRVLEKAFKTSFDEIFTEFDEKPMGIGAIAQVSQLRFAILLKIRDTTDDPSTCSSSAAVAGLQGNSQSRPGSARIPSTETHVHLFTTPFAKTSGSCTRNCTFASSRNQSLASTRRKDYQPGSKDHGLLCSSAKSISRNGVAVLSSRS